MNKAVLLGGGSVYREQVEAQLKTPWQLFVVPDSEAGEAFAGERADARALVANWFNAKIPPGAEVRLLQVGGAGTDLVAFDQVPAAWSVCNAYGHEDGMAEYVLMTILAWQHRFLETANGFKQGSWAMSGHANAAPHLEAAGRTAAIIGLGRIGQAVAQRLKGIGMRVIGTNRTPREKPANVDELFAWAEMDRMLAAADFTVLACALTDDTRGLIDAGRLAAMPAHGVLVNVSRGGVADEQALYAALAERRIGGAILDTWYRYPSAAEPEPRPSAYPFHELANVIMTPHSSGWTDGLFRRRGGEIAANLDALAQGRPLINLVRPPQP